MTKLTWGVVFLAGYWFTPKSPWVLGVAFLIIGISLVVSVLFDLYRRNLGGPTPQQAFSLVQDVLRELGDFYDEIEVITNKGIEVRVVSDNSNTMRRSCAVYVPMLPGSTSAPRSLGFSSRMSTAIT